MCFFKRKAVIILQIFELSKRITKTGKRGFKAILYEIHPDNCVVNNIGTQYNLNGITWIEKYSQKNIDSIKGMSVTVEFINEERTEILGHGETGIEDGVPVYNNATMIGYFEKGYITDVEINGQVSRVCMGEGYLDYMRYKPFIDRLEERMNNGEQIHGSIEIMGTPENDNKIVYLDGWKPKGRIPIDFVHSGWSILAIKPADEKSTLVELNQDNNKEDKINMDEKALKELIVSTIKETNSKNDELTQTISELNLTLSEKDKTINELNASIEQLQKALDDLKKEQETMWAERSLLEEEIAKLKVEKRLSELNEAISKYSEEEQKYAEAEINAFRENPLDGNIEAIVSKICISIVEKQKEATKTVEQNEANTQTNYDNDNGIDIFSEVFSLEEDENNESIF